MLEDPLLEASVDGLMPPSSPGLDDRSMRQYRVSVLVPAAEGRKAPASNAVSWHDKVLRQRKARKDVEAATAAD